MVGFYFIVIDFKLGGGVIAYFRNVYFVFFKGNGRDVEVFCIAMRIYCEKIIGEIKRGKREKVNLFISKCFRLLKEFKENVYLNKQTFLMVFLYRYSIKNIQKQSAFFI